jgi:nicotinamidase-related amidase
VTEQYRKGLGPTVSALAEGVVGFQPREKLAFSACGAEGIVTELRSKGICDAVLCGIEAHVCVTQTALDLLDLGFRVFVVQDAVGSRASENCQAGLDRMRSAGAIPVTTEMVLFELLEKAGTDQFKQILGLVK